MDHSLNFSSHCCIICSKANVRANYILRCFRTNYVDVLLRSFTVYVRHLVEYASPIWSPRLASDIDMVEWVQRRFTKRLPILSQLSNEVRQQQLNLDSLESRRIKTDFLLGLCFKIKHGFIAVVKNVRFIVDCDRVTRGHDLRIRRQHTVIHSFFISVSVLVNVGTIVVKSKCIQHLFLHSNTVSNLSILTIGGAFLLLLLFLLFFFDFV